ncbi:type II toxin-antitoxin system ParD family antitoxin [Rasiella sp. SM2506]|uniref:type II toxin-antitoxin system ParD family antitoxin n=1 Tax=Rasiella sp. SM2506 TaxID=3423914 RepID=UPI003D7AF7A3
MSNMDINEHFLVFLCKISELMNISFTEKQEKYIRDKVASGDYKNASEVVREALRQHESDDEKKLALLRAEIEKGWNGGISKKSMQDILNEKLEQYGVKKSS